MSNKSFIYGLIAAVAVIVGVMILVLWLSPPAGAEDRATWFKNLKQPGSGASCCDISDCKQTTAEWKHGQWYADVRGVEMPVPPERELQKDSIDGEAYVCSTSDRTILCFIPPNMSM